MKFKQSKNFFSIQYGTAPIILSVLHDGYRKNMDGLILHKQEGAIKKRDLNTRLVAKQIDTLLHRSINNHISLVINRIYRGYETKEIIQEYDDIIRQLVLSYKTSRVLLLDIHGFSTQPKIGTFDIILGTDHRKSLKQSNVDSRFTDFLQWRKYSVYQPKENKIEGESFGATTQETLVKRSERWHIPQLISMQVEIYRKFRIGREGRRQGMILAKDISSFLHEYIQELV